MNEILEKLREVKQKIKEVSEENYRLKTEKDSLSHKITVLETELETQKINVEDLEERNNLTKLASVIVSKESGGNDEIKRKIDSFIQEIDKCINLLS